MKAFIAQIDMNIRNFKGNIQKIITSLKQAQQEKAEIALFPELSLCGYPPEDLVLHDEFAIDCEQALAGLLPYTRDS